MTVPYQTPLNVSTAAAGATVFAYNFKIVAKVDLLVQVNGVTKIEGTHYTVSGVGLDAGGEVTFLAPLVGGETVVCKREMAFQRSTDFQNLGDLRSSTLNNDQDAPVMMAQQLKDEASRMLRLPLASTASPQLPDPIALRPLVWNAEATALENGDTTLTGDLLLRGDLASTLPGSGASLVGFDDAENWYDADNVRDALEALGNNRSFANSKSPVVDWAGKKILWLGTSIPHQGVGVDGYPERSASALAATVDNQAWSGSKASYNVAGSSTDITTVKSLSMTEDDRLAGLALYGTGSVYSDTFDLITKASQMTSDSRINARFQSTPFDVVVLDHAHNDRTGAEGTLTPESLAITAIATGATTQVTLSALGTIAVGDAVALEVTGISFLHHAAARVQSIAGSVITLNIDSSAYVGTFTAGTCYKLDRNTISGAWEFLLHYILNAGTRVGVTPAIILAGAPSEFTNGVYDANVRRTERILKKVANKWNISLFNIARQLDDNLATHITYFTDNVHPMTTVTRQVLANHWVEWLRGGAQLAHSATAFLPRGGTSAFVNNRSAVYSDFAAGFSTPAFLAGTKVLDTQDDFADGDTAGWTVAGAVPTVENAPWGVGKAVKFTSDGSASTTLTKALTLDKLVRAEFDLYLPQVSGLTTESTTRQFNVATFNAAGGTARYYIYLLVRKTSVQLAARYLTASGGSLITVPINFPLLDANTKYSIAFEVARATATYPGGFIVTVNGTRVSDPVEVADSAWAADVGQFTFGISAPNTLLQAIAYLGNVTIYDAPVSDYSTRYDGTFTTVDGKTITAVNGVVVSVTTGGPVMASGTYTPTLTNTTNASSSSVPVIWQYQRTGSTITVSGQVQITPTATGAVEVQATLPVASNFTGFGNAVGAGVTTSNGTNVPVILSSDPTSDMVRIQYTAGATALHNVWVHFTYRVM